ncbi:hypothetical protein F2P81_020083 [Scophthalmus maximus]|uniref:Phlebovirus glycoprotein G2 fusion domain-containing protein n=1 Tax=Scophthalmus maximus TaxID=52904 RepID=A0A6A4S841_SCOMX|nr:hypothetical protein F2P81_020083 [Scophthalmus maximus]
MMMLPNLTFVFVRVCSSAGRTVCSSQPPDCQESTWPTVISPLHTLHPAAHCPVSTGELCVCIWFIDVDTAHESRGASEYIDSSEHQHRQHFLTPSSVNCSLLGSLPVINMQQNPLKVDEVTGRQPFDEAVTGRNLFKCIQEAHCSKATSPPGCRCLDSNFVYIKEWALPYEASSPLNLIMQPANQHF